MGPDHKGTCAHTHICSASHSPFFFSQTLTKGCILGFVLLLRHGILTLTPPARRRSPARRRCAFADGRLLKVRLAGDAYALERHDWGAFDMIADRATLLSEVVVQPNGEKRE